MLSFFPKLPDIKALLSTKEDGNMRASSETPDSRENRRRFLAKNDIHELDVSHANLVHGTNVEVVDHSSPQEIPATDALITKEPGKFLTVTVADCYPIYFYDPKAQITGVAHAGWRGIVRGIIPKTIQSMNSLGASNRSILVDIGPGISVDNYEFGYRDFIKQFHRYCRDDYIRDSSTLNKINVDLQKIIKDQCKECNIPQTNITYSPFCSYDDNTLYSAREQQSPHPDVMMAVIGHR